MEVIKYWTEAAGVALSLLTVSCPVSSEDYIIHTPPHPNRPNKGERGNYAATLKHRCSAHVHQRHEARHIYHFLFHNLESQTQLVHVIGPG